MSFKSWREPVSPAPWHQLFSLWSILWPVLVGVNPPTSHWALLLYWPCNYNCSRLSLRSLSLTVGEIPSLFMSFTQLIGVSQERLGPLETLLFHATALLGRQLRCWTQPFSLSLLSFSGRPHCGPRSSAVFLSVWSVRLMDQALHLRKCAFFWGFCLLPSLPFGLH